MALIPKILQVRHAIAEALKTVTLAAGRTMTLTVREGEYDKNVVATAQAVVVFAKLGHAAEAPCNKTVRDVAYRVLLTCKPAGATGLPMPLEDYALQGVAEIEKAVMGNAALAALVETISVDTIENVPVLQQDTCVMDVIVICRVGYYQDDSFVTQT